MFWPPCSPDITFLDIFFWGTSRIIYQTSVPDLVTLRRMIGEDVHIVDVAMLRRVWVELECRLDILRATKGAHVEVK